MGEHVERDAAREPCEEGLPAAEHDGRVALVVAATKDLVAKGLNAGKVIRAVAAVVGGSGGGKPEFAQAGGKDPSKLDEALDKVPGIVNKELVQP